MIYSISGNIIKLPVIIKPRACNNHIIGIVNNRLKIAIKAVPVDGKANKELINYLSDILLLRKLDIVIVNGLNNNLKMINLPIAVLSKLDSVISQFIK